MKISSTAQNWPVYILNLTESLETIYFIFGLIFLLRTGNTETELMVNYELAFDLVREVKQSNSIQLHLSVPIPQ